MSRKISRLTTGHQTYFTPREFVEPLGVFDLDPASHVDRPWPTAKKHYTIEDNGLMLPWEGRIFLNPPYHRSEIEAWMNRMALHNDGIALIFARTDTAAWHESIFPFAHSLFFVRRRIRWIDSRTLKPVEQGVAPSVYVAYQEYNSDALADSGIRGRHIVLHPQIIMIGVTKKDDRTWKIVVDQALTELGGEARLKDLYDAVLRLAPEKTATNDHFQEKVRQTLQFFFERVDRGVYKKRSA